MGAWLVASAIPSGGATASTGLKGPCRGLMIREFSGKAEVPFIDSVVAHVLWRELETADGRFDGPGWEEIENARRQGLKIRLRVMAGVHAPEFVKRIGGPGISDPEHGTDCSKTGGIAIWNRHDKRPGVIPRFWQPEVLDQYEQLMAEVARRYEGAPEIREVVASGCMTTYAEPFYRAHDDAGSNSRLFRAGLDIQKDLAAHRRVIEIHHRLFHRTRTSLAINAWDVIDASPAHRCSSFERTVAFVRWARGLMGEKLVLQNNGAGTDTNPERGTPETNHFAFLKSVPGPKGLQTRTLQRLGGSTSDLCKVLDSALRMGADFVELPSGFQRLDLNQLEAYDKRLEATPIGGR